MKKSFLLVLLLALGVSRLLAGWITPPPATATVGATVSVTANGYVSAPSPYGPPGFLVLWTQSTANGPWSISVLNTSYNGTVSGTASRTLTAGQWTWDVRSITTSPSGTSPSGTQVAWATTTVGSSTSRSVSYQAPVYANPYSAVTVSVTASTSATDSEQIGFLHWEYSTNNGASWTPIAYDQNLGKTATRQLYVMAAGDGSTIRLRTRVAFRYGSAGDVDLTGIAIDWNGTWNNWQVPVTKELSIPVFQNAQVLQFNVSSDPVQNTNNLVGIMNSIAGTSNAKILQFPAGTINFTLPWYSGQLGSFSNVHNLVVRGAPGDTVIKWRVQSDYAAHSFFGVNADCSNIEFRNLTFTTWLEDDASNMDRGQGQGGTSWKGRQGDGTHIKTWGKTITIDSCTFKASPGFAIAVADGNNDAAVDDIHINANQFYNNMGDPIHVHTGKGVWIVGNWIDHCGDDAIAVVADNYANDGQKADSVNILSNTIKRCEWRGIAILTADNVDVKNNRIDPTGGYRIEINSILAEKNIQSSDAGQWPSNINLHEGMADANTIDYSTQLVAKDGTLYTDHAIIKRY